MVGRPSDYTPETAAEICGRLVDGESLRGICSEECMPDIKTVYRWIGANPEFRQQYALAREDQADTLADDILKIADTPVLGVKTKTNAEGEVETTEGDMIEHRRLQVDARKWVAAKLKPKKYGDKVTNEHGGIGGGPVVVEHTFKSAI